MATQQGFCLPGIHIQQTTIEKAVIFSSLPALVVPIAKLLEGGAAVLPVVAPEVWVLGLQATKVVSCCCPRPDANSKRLSTGKAQRARRCEVPKRSDSTNCVIEQQASLLLLRHGTPRHKQHRRAMSLFKLGLKKTGKEVLTAFLFSASISFWYVSRQAFADGISSARLPQNVQGSNLSQHPVLLQTADWSSKKLRGG